MNPRQFLLESDRFMAGQATPACITSDSILGRDREGQVADRKVCLLDRHCLLEQHRCTHPDSAILSSPLLLRRPLLNSLSMVLQKR